MWYITYVIRNQPNPTTMTNDSYQMYHETLPKGSYMILTELPMQLWQYVESSEFRMQDGTQYIPTSVVKEFLTAQQWRELESEVTTLMVTE